MKILFRVSYRLVVLFPMVRMILPILKIFDNKNLSCFFRPYSQKNSPHFALDHSISLLIWRYCYPYLVLSSVYSINNESDS